MGLHWNAGHVAVYNLIQGGAANKELKAKGYKKSLIDMVATLIGAVLLGFTKELQAKVAGSVNGRAEGKPFKNSIGHREPPRSGQDPQADQGGQRND